MDKLKNLEKALNQEDFKKSIGIWTDFNIFDVLNIAEMEIRHSRILSWLLNANNFSDSFVKSVFGNYDVFNDVDWYDFKVIPEFSFNDEKNKKKHRYIDVVLKSKSQRIIIIIENKVNAEEGVRGDRSQLDIYYEYVNSHYKTYKKYYFYLDPKNREISKKTDSKEFWKKLEYSKIDSSLEELINSNELNEKEKMFVIDYSKVVKRVMEKNQDTNSNIKAICQQMYEKHKDAFDLVFKYSCKKQIITDVIHNVLGEYSKNGKLIYCDDNSQSKYHHFRTKKMDNLVYKGKENDYRGQKQLYWFEITQSDEHTLRGALTVSVGIDTNITGEINYICKKFNVEFKPNNNGTYKPLSMKTVFSTPKTYRLNNTDYSKLKSKTEDAVKEIIEYLLDKTNSL